ncbi:DUF6503 family protein [Yeosuana sp. AK3]
MKAKNVFKIGFVFVSLMSCAHKNKKIEYTASNTAIESRYYNNETKRVIEKMITAHGGLTNWNKKPSISYIHTYVSPYDPSDPWTSHEIIEQGSRRVYQNWSLDKAEIIYNGKDFYGVNWKRGNPPKFTAHLAMYFSNLPWLTQDFGVKLGEVRKRRILDEPKEYFAVKMTFDDAIGVSSNDYYDLLIDPETYTLAAVEYIMTYGAILDSFELPKDVKFLGPFIKKVESYDTIEGLKMPTKIVTLGPKGEDYGFHTYENWSFSKPFNDDLVLLPEDALLDSSSNKRKE